MINFHYEGYRSTDLKTIRDFIRNNPLAMIVTHHNQDWGCSMVPMVFDDTEGVYIGHCDANNRQFHGSTVFDCYVVFSGGNCYIPSEAYLTKQLPTWNYTSVNGEGELEIIEDPSEKYAALKLLSQEMSVKHRRFDLAEHQNKVDSLMNGIVALKLNLKNIEGRFKLSQDKHQDDVDSALDHFAATATKNFNTEYAKLLIASTMGKTGGTCENL